MAIEINGTPAPAGTLAISLTNDGQLQLYMPGVNSRGYTLRLPTNQRGMDALARILTEHRRAPRTPIGAGDASPTQQIVEHWLNHNSPTRPPAKPEPPRVETPPELLEEILMDLDL